MMDLETYIARYTGETRYRRLLLIGRSRSRSTTVTNDGLSEQAFRLAEQQFKHDGNVVQYTSVFGTGTSDASSGGGDANAPEVSTVSGGDGGGGSTSPQRRTRTRPAGAAAAGPPQRTSTTIQPDPTWVAQQEEKNRMDRSVLQGRLSTAQSHLHKEAIRQAYLALADHDLKTGNTSQSLSGLIRAVDYCMNRQQTCQISLQIIQVAFALEQYSTVREFVNKIEHTVGTTATASTGTGRAGGGGGGAAAVAAAAGPSSVDQMQQIKIKVGIAKGIERLIQGDYKASANILIPLVLKSGNMTTTTSSSSTSTSSAGGSGSSEGGGSSGSTGGSTSGGNVLEWPGVTSPEDVAIYASMMALVTQDRARILELAEHPEALELVPTMKELLLQCSRANYVQCMRTFCPHDGDGVTMQPQQQFSLSLSPIGTDVYVTPSRWNGISHQIREMCLIQYLKPYQCVKLESMHQLFYPAVATIEDLQNVLLDLMSRELLPPNMRLDTRSNTLFQIAPSVQKSTKDQINVMEERVLDDTYAMLVRLACLESGLIIQDPNQSPTRGGSHGGGGGRSARNARARGRGTGGGLFSVGGSRGGGGAAGASASDPVDADDGDSDEDDEVFVDNAADAVDMMAEGVDAQMIDAEANPQ